MSHKSGKRFKIDNSLYVWNNVPITDPEKGPVDMPYPGLPNPLLIQGLYVNRLDPEHDTLVLTSIEAGMSFGFNDQKGNKLFFLLTRDSLNNSKMIIGVPSYTTRSDQFDDSIGCLTLRPENRVADWTASVYLEDSTSDIKRLVIKDFFQHRIEHLKYQMDYYPPTPLLNSRGKPYLFQKIVYLEK